MALGDQVYVYREFLNQEGIYEHHGIDCGDDTVIHYRKPSEVIERTSMMVFARGNLIYVKEYLQGFTFIPELVVHRAKSRIGEKQYNLLFNNCEHFATWCKTGISDSKQVRDFIPIISRIKVDSLYEPLQQAFQATDAQNAQELVQQALGDIKVVWDQVQPQYQQALEEMKTWQKVAETALNNHREDLARAALSKKLEFKKQATQLQGQMQELAQMTTNLLKNQKNL